jgi:glycosyltransferase involved in cell wall biosynthesis
VKIAVFVHGRFHGFDLARELLALGEDVTLFTNYPRSVVQRFEIPRERVRSFLAHGLLSRGLWKVFPGGLGGRVERVCNTVFARWAARQIRREPWDVVIGWSGVSEETFRALRGTSTLKVLQRGSAHIREQHRLLAEEEARAGHWILKPSRWIIEREEREYELADVIHVLSTFALRSFLERNISRNRLFPLSLGVNLRKFRPSAAALEARRERLRRGDPLRVLTVGTFCYRKGALDLAELARTLPRERFHFRWVGPVAAEAAGLCRELAGDMEFPGKRPLDRLPEEYAWGDVFLFPTVEDGFAVVLCQALASGLPLLTSANCAGPDLIREGENGWVLPIHEPAVIASQLRWCDEHRTELAAMVDKVSASWQDLDWSQTGRQAMQNILAALSYRESSKVSLGAVSPG